MDKTAKGSVNLPLKNRKRKKTTEKPLADRMTVRDWLVSVAVALCLVVASWALGGMTPATRVLLFGVALLPLVLCLLPLPEGRAVGTVEWGPGSRTQWIRLLRFPVFWLGVILLGYVGLQTLNPAYTVVRYENLWWLTEEGLSPREGWPQSIAAPFAQGNNVTFLLRWGAGLALACAIWVGIRHRPGLIFILWVLTINAAVYALLAILQQITGTEKVLWTFDWVNPHHSGAFYYRNHGAAFLVMLLSLVLALGLYSRRVQALRVKLTGPFPLLLAIGILVAGALVAALSRAAWIGGGLVGAGFVILAIYSFVHFSSSRREWLGSVLMLVAILFFGGVIYSVWDTDRIQERYERLMSSFQDLDSDRRMVGNRLSLTMWEDRSLYGWGADNYRQAFFFYTLDFPELLRSQRGAVKTQWVAAHNDYLQLLAELGVVGSIPIALIALFYLGHWLLRLRWVREWHLMLLLGIAAFLFQIGLDLHLLSTTLLLYFTFMVVVFSRLLDFQRDRSQDVSFRLFSPRSERSFKS